MHVVVLSIGFKILFLKAFWSKLADSGCESDDISLLQVSHYTSSHNVFRLLAFIIHPTIVYRTKFAADFHKSYRDNNIIRSDEQEIKNADLQI